MIHLKKNDSFFSLNLIVFFQTPFFINFLVLEHATARKSRSRERYYSKTPLTIKPKQSTEYLEENFRTKIRLIYNKVNLKPDFNFCCINNSRSLA